MKQVASFIVGAVFGAAVMVAVRGHDLQHFYEQVLDLKGQVEQLTIENENLKKDLQQQKKGAIQRVRKIDVNVDAADEMVRLEAGKFARDQLKPLIQTRIDALDDRPGELIDRLLENQQITVENSTYRLHVVSKTISDTLRVDLVCQKVLPIKN